jgi:FemAB-related protein (PEP-CTERM system-associated)
MIRSNSPIPPIRITVHGASTLPARLPAIAEFVMAKRSVALSRHPAWLNVLRDGLQHEVYAVEALTADGRTCGFLPLAFVSSLLFGRYLVSLPYLNSNGVIADAADVQALLIDRAVALSDELNAKHLELRHEIPIQHPLLGGAMTSKVHMRLALPETAEKLWKSFDAKVRNQIRKGEKNSLTVTWGGQELLDDFYHVLSHNMRDLGTPVYSFAFFAEVLAAFAADAELCVVKAGEQPIACALLLHGQGVSEVPTASSLREFNATCANMFMYRHLLDRAVERRQRVFDFGRSTIDGPTFKFKKQWGAEPHPATWQYHLRSGQLSDMRPENPRYQRMIRLWQKLPVRVTQYLGPSIVRGIP